MTPDVGGTPERREPSKAVLTSLSGLLQNGSDDDIRMVVTDQFVRKHLIYCPSINNDMTDGWGMFGYSRGFIYVARKRHNDTRTLNEDMWQQGKTGKGIEVGRHIMLGIPHYDFFPGSLFEHTVIRSEAETRQYHRLLEVMGITDADLSGVELVDVGLLDAYEHLGIDPNDVSELRLPREPDDPADWWKKA